MVGKGRAFASVVIALVVVIVGAPAALACGGLVAPNGTIALTRTTTLAGYHNGIEHYVTAFEFAGEAEEVGSIVPLPGKPTEVIRGGDWTLQRLVQEITPPPEESFFKLGATTTASADSASVVLRTTIDALDIVVLEGGGDAVGEWAKDHGFLLPPDAPEVLDFYASRSPYFMAARFDGQRAGELDQSAGDSTPVHLVIPTDHPWVPLRILALGQDPEALVQADVFLLTDEEPNMLPYPVTSAADDARAPGMVLDTSEAASDLLISDLRSDKNMNWVDPNGMWLSYLKIDAEARSMVRDLAIDPTGESMPSMVDAGYPAGAPVPDEPIDPAPLWWLAGVGVVAGIMVVLVRQGDRQGGPTGRAV